MSTSGVPDFSSIKGTTGSEPQEVGAPKGGATGAAGASAFKAQIAGLKDMTPEEFNTYMELLAQNFCNEIKKSNDRLIREMKKHRER